MKVVLRRHPQRKTFLEFNAKGQVSDFKDTVCGNLSQSFVREVTTRGSDESGDKQMEIFKVRSTLK